MVNNDVHDDPKGFKVLLKRHIVVVINNNISVKFKEWKCENADDTKQNKRRQEVNAISCGSVKQG
ncbi:hypothetical protein T09_6647 [Trichinella sp. T9]|nr:hypothetical protein T09_6647 [Trichinella sp. T9]